MMLVKASADSEAGVLPTTEQFAEMGKYNEELVKAGVMLAGEGLHPTSRGARIVFKGNNKTVVDGPFAETKELIAGFWIIQAKSLEEAIEWARRAPNPHWGGDTNIEVRQVFSTEDFGEALTPELIAKQNELRAMGEANQRG
ncbi:MAG: dehydrogenase [Gemmatimonadetes bacterium]|nr:MAG: dehydrogenase [Gemmatimonadota bacterium]